MPRTPRRPRRLALPIEGLEVEALPPAPDGCEALLRGAGPAGQVVGLLRVDAPAADGRGVDDAGAAVAARQAGALRAHLEHWLAAGSPVEALHRLDRWVGEASGWVAPVRCSLLAIDPDRRRMTYYQAGGMPLLRMRRFHPSLRAVTPLGAAPGAGRGRYRGAELGWPVDESLVLFSAPLFRAYGRDRLLRLLAMLASGRGVVSLAQTVAGLRRVGLAEEGAMIQVRLAPSHFRAHGAFAPASGRVWEALPSSSDW